VVNAIRYTRQGEIRIKAESRGHHVAVSVSDTGEGIPLRILVPYLRQVCAGSRCGDWGRWARAGDIQTNCRGPWRPDQCPV
jgi:hypothetical protein